MLWSFNTKRESFGDSCQRSEVFQYKIEVFTSHMSKKMKSFGDVWKRWGLSVRASQVHNMICECSPHPRPEPKSCTHACYFLTIRQISDFDFFYKLQNLADGSTPVSDIKLSHISNVSSVGIIHHFDDWCSSCASRVGVRLVIGTMISSSRGSGYKKR